MRCSLTSGIDVDRNPDARIGTARDARFDLVVAIERELQHVLVVILVVGLRRPGQIE
jgi:hypothetical protein